MVPATLFVSNFPFSTTEDELRALVVATGPVRRIRIIADRVTGRSRGFAFVELADPSTVDSVIGALDGTNFRGRRIAVTRAKIRGAAAASETSAGGNGNGFPPFVHRIVVDWVESSRAYVATVPDLGIAVEAKTIEAAVGEAESRGRRELAGQTSSGS